MENPPEKSKTISMEALGFINFDFYMSLANAYSTGPNQQSLEGFASGQNSLFFSKEWLHGLWINRHEIEKC